jgi:glycerophosphoryl diester phosphodiesterase
VEDWHVEGLVMFSSFRHEYLPLCKERLANVPTAALVEDVHPANLIEYLKSLHVDGYHMNDELAEKESVQKLRKAGFFVNVYTVNDPLRAKELFEMGVNGVFTDFLK